MIISIDAEKAFDKNSIPIHENFQEIEMETSQPDKEHLQKESYKQHYT